MPKGLDASGDVLGNELAFAHDHLVINDVDDRVPRTAATDGLRQGHRHAVALVDDLLGDRVHGAAVIHSDDDVLGHVRQLTGQVAGISGLECRVRQSFPRAVGRGEVLQHLQAFPEVGLDGRLDDLARGLGHQATHPAQLPDLVHGSTCTGGDHAVDRVHVARLLVEILGQHIHQHRTHFLTGLGPVVDDLEVALALGDDTLVIGLLDLVDF